MSCKFNKRPGRHRREDTEKRRGQADIGVVQPQAKNGLELPEAKRGKEGFTLESLRRKQGPGDTQILDVWPPEL